MKLYKKQINKINNNKKYIFVQYNFNNSQFNIQHLRIFLNLKNNEKQILEKCFNKKLSYSKGCLNYSLNNVKHKILVYKQKLKRKLKYFTINLNIFKMHILNNLIIIMNLGLPHFY